MSLGNNPQSRVEPPSGIIRPELEYDDAKHEYRLNGEKLNGVSTVAKIGDDDVWGVAAAWAFRIGYEGALEVLYDFLDGYYLSPPVADICTPDGLREALKQARKTPWHKTDDAKERGTSIHDALEHLAQKGEVPILENYPEAQRGYITGLCRWYLDYRPKFEATEVQVASVEHRFAGRYDIRCIIERPMTPHNQRAITTWLCLVDLKTGKRIYPTSQFPQLAGYELASVEMGFPATDAQYVLNVHDDGSYDFKRSNAEAEHFLAYLAAQRAILDLKQKNKPERKRKKS